MSTHHIFLPASHAKLRALNRHSATARIHGGGTGTVLLDGGIGGQSSYYSIDDYMKTTGRDPYNNQLSRPQLIPALKSGTGLADKIASKLSKLSLDKPKKAKKKNIVMSF
jgi:hypothetical protein